VRGKDLQTSIFWAVFGLYIAFEGYKLELGPIGRPKPGFFVFWAGTVLLALSMILFVRAFRTRKKVETTNTLWKGLRWDKVLRLMVVLFVYAVIFKFLGFLLSTFFLLLFLFKGIERQKWSKALILSAATMVLTYLIFLVFLEAQFPEGVLGKIFEQFKH